jgi:hypothetical protein
MPIMLWHVAVMLYMVFLYGSYQESYTFAVCVCSVSPTRLTEWKSLVLPSVRERTFYYVVIHGSNDKCQKYLQRHNFFSKWGYSPASAS